MPNPSTTECIKTFLMSQPNQMADLATLYYKGMECQVNVAQDGGRIITGEFKGRTWKAYTDEITIWKHKRIPYNAATVPHYDDPPLNFDLAAHAEGIGMTGWDWIKRTSKYVAFDFDSIINHSKGLIPEELKEVQRIAAEIPWVSVRKSTSGHGIHLYVFLEDVQTMNHCEHAALSRAILAKISNLTGFDFQARIDVCGGNMWVWHRKMLGTDGLSLIKAGSAMPESEVPVNWRDHLSVVTRKRYKVEPFANNEAISEEIEDISNRRNLVQLTEEHKRVLKELMELGGSWFDRDHNMLITHTAALKVVHEKLELRGLFTTLAEGTNLGNDHNAFCYPEWDGSWVVRRYSKHEQETNLWEPDSNGWTRCWYNRHPTLAIACKAFDGVEREKGGFFFREASVALSALASLGVHILVANPFQSRETILIDRKDGRLTVKVKREKTDDASLMQGWSLEKDDYWTYITKPTTKASDEPELVLYDDMLRHLVTENGSDAGWVIKLDNRWVNEPIAHVRMILASFGMGIGDINTTMGNAIKGCWKLVNKPFEPEYPGSREWNRDAAQLRFLPKEDPDDLKYPHWRMILDHCGQGLDAAVMQDNWCQINGIETGADYLKCWIASMFQEPLQPLPYLFFYGEQNSGKSILWEALSLLVSKGVVDAGTAIKSKDDFNKELESAILCVIEELDLRKNIDAYTKIKQWVTAVTISVHEKFRTPFMTRNTTHWMHFANSQDACPVFPGDTRVVVIQVPNLDPLDLVPKKQLLECLKDEAKDFITEILNLNIPVSTDRLNVPPIMTQAKYDLEQTNESELQTFLREHCYYVEGATITVENLWEAFIRILDPIAVNKWSKIRMGKEMPKDKYPKGRLSNGSWAYGNLSLTKGSNTGRKVIRDTASEFLIL